MLAKSATGCKRASRKLGGCKPGRRCKRGAVLLSDPRRYFRSEQMTHGQPQGMRRCVRASVVVIVGRDVASRTER
ncbi:MAG TPA: hypothetical protein VNM90_19465 [Haliangium sp.]|nr:hypothetical protein [Haliangium sp.]